MEKLMTKYMVKLFYLLLFVTLSACNQSEQDKNAANHTETNGAVETASTESIEAVAGSVSPPIKQQAPVDALIFQRIIKQTPIKSLPLTDKTNFDNFRPDQFLDKAQVEALQLDTIYPDFFKEGLDYKAAASYRLHYSDAFYTLIVTVLQGESSLESLLINYATSNYKVLDHRLITLDDNVFFLAETMTKMMDDGLIKVNTFSHKDPERQILWTFIIDADTGTITSVKSPHSALVEHVLERQTDINRLDIQEEMVTTQIFFDHPEDIILLIPEIAEESQGYTALNSHIYLVNNATKAIHTTFDESYTSNGWVSDAIRLSEINIDKVFYPLTETSNAFAIKTRFDGMSAANPYAAVTMSLYVKSGDTLKKVLSNYTIYQLNGKSDGSCRGEDHEEENMLTTSSEKTNGYYDILVTHQIKKTIIFLENGNCEATETITKQTSTLKFDGEKYQ